MDHELDAELERRLQRMESPGGGGMVQSDLPLKDIIICVVVLAVTSGLLLWWSL